MPEVWHEPESMDLARYVRQDDLVVWGQACAEPVTLTEMLLRQRERIGRFRCFLGMTITDTPRPEHADLVSFVGYCGTGANEALHRAGALDVLPVRYSTYPDVLGSGPLRADVALVQVSPPDADGRYRLGLGVDYLPAAIRAARVVIAEVNDQVPRSSGSVTLAKDDLDAVLHTSRPPAEFTVPQPDATTLAVARNVAGLISDGATLQFGVGALPETVLSLLADRRDLGVHTGLVNDAMVELIQAGVVTGARKSVDSGLSVAGVVMGSRKAIDFLAEHPEVELRDSHATHGARALAEHERFVAINSAIEVDLTGAVNAELAGSRYVGAVGGAPDFLRAAAISPGGLPIVALPATAGARSRIVTELNGPASTARADAGVIVTEYGVADLRGQPLAERRRRMLAIAHPAHRDALESALRKGTDAG